MNNLMKLLYIVSWVLIGLLFFLPLWILGLFVIPIALLMGDDSDDWHELFWVWGNDEEGCPDWWKTAAATGEEGWMAEKFPCWWWYAMRNTVNNSRYIFEDRKPSIKSNWDVNVPMEAGLMIAAGVAVAYRWAWSGPFAGYRRVWLTNPGEYSEIWFGWKVGSVVPGLGFTAQVRRNRKIGT